MRKSTMTVLPKEFFLSIKLIQFHTAFIMNGKWKFVNGVLFGKVPLVGAATVFADFGVLGVGVKIIFSVDA